MKKLITAVAAILIAVVAQAAAVNWSAAGNVVKATDGTSRASYYTALAFFADQKDAVNAALASADFEALSSLAKGSSQAAKAGSFSGKIEGVDASAVDVFMVVFDTAAAGDAISTAKNYYVTAAVSSPTYSGTDLPTTATFTAAQMTGTWTSISVPEPTSGLLLLLGMAGLALKRKKA